MNPLRALLIIIVTLMSAPLSIPLFIFRVAWILSELLLEFVYPGDVI